MKRIVLMLLVCATTGMPGMFPQQASAAGLEDLNAALQELKKEPAAQDAALIDTLLAGAVATPESLRPAQYQQARMLQEQRRVEAMADKTPPEKRMEINEAGVQVIGEIARNYIGEAPGPAAPRYEAYRAQLVLAAQISDSVRARTVEADLVKAMLADLDSHYVTVSEARDEDKETAIQEALRNVNYVKDLPQRQEFVKALYGRYLKLGTDAAKTAMVAQARARASGGDVAGAVGDLSALVENPETADDLKLLARTARMNLLAGQEQWLDAAHDADVLPKIMVKDATGAVFTPLDAAGAKRQAIRVLLANGTIDPAAMTNAMDALCLEVLPAENMSAEEKSLVITDVFLERAASLAGSYQWEPALAWAKVAYNTAPNPRIGQAIMLVQQILGNRSRTPLAKDSFSLAKVPADIEAAATFYTRQSGIKKDGSGVTLAADLSNLQEFPGKLAGVASPFSEAMTAAVANVAAESPDAMTRALAWGLLGDHDKALEVMSAAINALPLDAAEASPMVNFTARFVRAKFESVALANAFLESQVDGPAGKDGQLGTADDKPNPLDATKE